MATDPPVGVTGYEHDSLKRILGETAHVLRIIGFAGDGLTIIGGLVPSLPVPVIDPAFGQPHVGTRDIDLCLSIALTENGAQEWPQRCRQPSAECATN